ncbi:MAG TPA: putative sulfate exporter family transporter [Gemmatimonadaceae bacterium]|nr:putative sulfate exporter family transporter [Gemmatimonadaceae bacterium]
MPATVSSATPFFRLGPLATRLAPGVLLATVVGLVSLGIAGMEERAFGHPIVEGLVVAILLGMLIRTLWTPSGRLDAGIGFTAKEVLEVAVLLLGASVDLPLLLRAGPALAIGIVLLVVLGIAFSYGIGRAMGLPHKLSVLVACGNSICGNSAIAAVAPVIRADKEHVASSIAFTAILGVVVVIGLPFLIRPLALSFYQYGVLAGLTVYAVPQVLAAAFPVSVLSGQVGTLVKLVRVLMLGPVVLFFALKHRNDADAPGGATASFSITRFVPWFIIGFLALAGLRSAGGIPLDAATAMKSLSMWLTVAAMAALGLGVDLRAIARVGRPVILTVTGSLVVLVALSVALIHLLSIR